jgi:hypothetical protein
VQRIVRLFWAVLFGVVVLSLPSRIAAARPVDVTGTWRGPLPVDGIERPVVVQLHQRADGSVIGYLLGGTSARVVVKGGVSSRNQLSLQIERAEPGRTILIAVDGRVGGGRLRGTAGEDGASRSITWNRVSDDIAERRFVLAPGGDGDAAAEAAVALDRSGRLVAGAFASRGVCGPFGCGGAVTLFEETGGGVTFKLEAAGSCPVSTSLSATFDAAALAYRGTFNARDCHGLTSGPVLAGRWTRTRTADVAGGLAVLGRLGDDLEGGSAFAAGYAPVSSSYLHFGRTAADLLASLRAEVSRYTSLQIDFNRFRGFDTIPDPETFPDLVRPPGVDFHDQRVGTPRTGGDAVVYRDTETDLAHSELKHLRAEKGGWRITGNQSAALDLPFRYSLVGAAVVAPTAGAPIRVSLGSWGAHFTPLTGHSFGDRKSNLAGFFSAASSELREIAGDGTGDDDGVCEPGEACAYPTTAAAIRDRTPVYIAPLDGAVTRVEYQGPAPEYFDGVQRWDVRLRLDLGIEIRFGHLARIAPALRGLILARTGIDTDTYAGPTGDLLRGATLAVPAGTELARPQVLAAEVPANPGLFRGGGTFGDRPWAQMEYFVTTDDGETCIYDLLPPDRSAALQRVLDGEMADPAAQRYVAYQPTRWTWTAEGLLCPAARPAEPILAGLGGWFERPSAGVADDELFAIVPIARAAASYSPALYTSPGVEVLALRRKKAGAGSFSWTLPGGSTASPFYPDGEVLDRTPSTLLLRWRDVAPSALYQRAAYSITDGVLKIQWGPLAASPEAAALPLLDPAAPCDGVDVVCYDQENRGGF